MRRNNKLLCILIYPNACLCFCCIFPDNLINATREMLLSYYFEELIFLYCKQGHWFVLSNLPVSHSFYLLVLI